MNNKTIQDSGKKPDANENVEKEKIDIVDEASMESFPASDPPNYTQRRPEHEPHSNEKKDDNSKK